MSFILLGILNSQAAGAGGAGAYDLLETTVLTSSASSVSFTGLGAYSDYKHLQIRNVALSNTPTNRRVRVTINSDTGTNYSQHVLSGDGSSVSSFNSTPRSNIEWLGNTTSLSQGAGAGIIDILDFSDTNKYSTLRTLGGYNDTSLSQIWLASGLWNNTDAITSLSFSLFSDDFAAGSRFSIYGIR